MRSSVVGKVNEADHERGTWSALAPMTISEGRHVCTDGARVTVWVVVVVVVVIVCPMSDVPCF